MNKNIDYTKFDPYFVEQVRKVIAEGDRHKYSVSRVYGAYNRAYGKNDKPQSCSSCLRNRVRELRKWYKGYEAAGGGSAEVTAENDSPQYTDPAEPGFVPPEIGVIRIPMRDSMPFDFTPSKDSDEKGKVRYADGAAVKAGTYQTATGDEIAVQPGGKATLKTNELL